jgi:hypothetical protein
MRGACGYIPATQQPYPETDQDTKSVARMIRSLAVHEDPLLCSCICLKMPDAMPDGSEDLCDILSLRDPLRSHACAFLVLRTDLL